MSAEARVHVPYDSNSDHTPLVHVVTAMLRNWRILVILPLLFGLVAGVLSMRQTRTYAASASFVPQSAGARRASSSALIARQLGVGIGGDGSADSPQFYADLVRGRTVLRQVVEAQYTVPDGQGGSRTTTLLELLRARAGSPSPYTWREAIRDLRTRMTVAVARETGVINVTARATEPALAEQIVQKVLDVVNEFNLNTRRSQAGEESRFVAERLRESQANLLRAEDQLQRFLQRNRAFRASPELLFEHDRLERQVTIRQEIYSNLAQSFEQSRIEAARDIPVISVIDPPADSAEPVPRGTILRALLGILLGLVVAAGIIIVSEVIGRSPVDAGSYQELRRVRQQMWQDIRNPKRWFSPRRSRVANITV
jgi:uncharacterized protein involved in exopolysaccharide biosynthesis